MQNKVDYEWTTETIDADGDIIDSSFYDKLSSISKDDFKSNDVGLVRNEGNEADGLEDRFWAYIKDGKLPEYFVDGGGHSIDIKVPQKFHKELSAYLKNQLP